VESMRSFNNEAMKLAVRGVTIVVSTGDDGAANGADYCDFDSSSDKWSPYWKVSHALSQCVRNGVFGHTRRQRWWRFHGGLSFTCNTHQYVVLHG
jgi:hypothetical protein